MLKLFKSKNSMSQIEKGMVYLPPRVGHGETKEMERCFARLFSSDDGQKALAYLQSMTFQRALSHSSSNDQLRYIEGQRALVANILRLIDRGRRG